MQKSKPRFAFFGTPRFATIVLDELAAAGYLPALIVTAPDAPVGRGLTLTSPAVKQWADRHDIASIQPTSLAQLPKELTGSWDFFVVAAYGKLLRKNVLDIPTQGTLNVHPSLLPKLRGASPIESAILTDEKETGVSIMLLDEKMDHGPILAQKKVAPKPWPPRASELEDTLAHEGGRLLAVVIAPWQGGELNPTEQDHTRASVTKKIEKGDGLIDLTADPYQNFLKIRALEGWPGTYFFHQKQGRRIRVKIVDATYTPGSLTITRVIPEGKREMSYPDFLRGK